jgi:TPR repeat protein
MRLRFIPTWAALALLVMVAGAWGQSADVTASQSIATLKRQADNGDAKAQFQLGRDYVRGDGVPQDFAQAALWYRKAADQGLAEAQSSLGGAYRLGLGLPKDDAQAAFWLRKAANQGDGL